MKLATSSAAQAPCICCVCLVSLQTREGIWCFTHESLVPTLVRSLPPPPLLVSSRRRSPRLSLSAAVSSTNTTTVAADAASASQAHLTYANESLSPFRGTRRERDEQEVVYSIFYAFAAPQECRAHFAASALHCKSSLESRLEENAVKV